MFPFLRGGSEKRHDYPSVAFCTIFIRFYEKKGIAFSGEISYNFKKEIKRILKMQMKQKITILDTDIGNDIDDTWALGLLLKTPELFPALVLSCSGDTGYRAAVAAAFLDRTGCGEIPVGVGLRRMDEEPEIVESLHEWLAGYSLDDYPGRVVQDGIAEAISIMENAEEISVIGIGPMTNLAEICRRRPDLAEKCRLTAMAGSLRKNFRDCLGQVAEYNIVTDLPAAQTVFRTKWKEFTLTPLDHCGNIVLSGEEYRRMRSAGGCIAREIIASYHTWLTFGGKLSDGMEQESSILYDTAAVHLAASDRFTRFEQWKLIVDDAGFLRSSENGMPVRVAMDWNDFSAYRRELLAKLAPS